MTHQLTFDEVRRARADDPVTSKVAAREARGLASEHRAKILGALADADLTAGEIAERCGLTSLQVSRRMAELRDQVEVRAVEIEPGVPVTRPTPSGRPARVWRIA